MNAKRDVSTIDSRSIERLALPVMSQSQKVPTPKDWADRYAEIERLYVHERRKLRFVMQYMEQKYVFKAT